MDEEIIREKALYSEESERAVIGCMLVEPEKYCEMAIESLQPSDFFVNTLRRFFVCLSAMWNRNESIDALTVNQALKAHGFDNESETISELSDAYVGYQKLESMPSYLATVKLYAHSREVQAIAIKLIHSAQGHQQREDKEAAVAQATKRLDELSCGSKIDVIEGSQAWDDFYALMANPEEDVNSQVLPTGYGHFDEAVKVRGGQVIVIAAVQKHGKSSLALNMAVRWWSQQIPGCVCSLEMRLRDLQSLIMSNVTGIVRDSFEDMRMDDAKLANLFQGTMKAKNWPHAIYEKPSLKSKDFRALAREQARKGAKFMVLDYFQLMQTDRQGYSDNRAGDLEEMMRGIKCVALETNLAIVLLSQLNTKQIEGKAENRPSLAHLRGTGAIAQDADVVMLLSEPKPDVRPQGMRQLLGDIAANRRGPEKEIKWLLDGAHARFLEC